MRTLRALIASAAAIGGVLAGITPASASLPAPGNTGREKLTWSSCNDTTTPALQCAMLSVPLDYAHPDGIKVKLKPDDTFTAYLRDGSLPAGKGFVARTCAPDPAPVYRDPTCLRVEGRGRPHAHRPPGRPRRPVKPAVSA